MAWNPSPKVADCRDIARKWRGKDQVIILAIDRKSGTLEMATYGETKALCADAKRMGDAAYDAVMNVYDPDIANPVVRGATESRTSPPRCSQEDSK